MPLEGADIPVQWTVFTCIPGGDTTVLSLQLSQIMAVSHFSGSALKPLDPCVLAGKKITFPCWQLDWACWKTWEALLRPQGHWRPLRERFLNVEKHLEGLRMLQCGLSLPCILAALATREVCLQKTTLFPPETGSSLLQLTEGKGRCGSA